MAENLARRKKSNAVSPRLKDVKPTDTGRFKSKQDAEDETNEWLERLYDSLYLMFAEAKRSLLVILHGIDASGKDGTVLHIFKGSNPQGIRVSSFKKPTDEELKHDFLWRCHRAMPEAGSTAIFNRSYYEEVTTVRVHPEILKQQHLPDEVINDPKIFERRFAQINAFENMLSENGVMVVKFLLHISKSEQKKRLQDRVKDKTKNWKFSPQDLLERKHWSEYMECFDEMIANTHSEQAPWHIIPADKKWYRNHLVTKILVETLAARSMKFPKV